MHRPVIGAVLRVTAKSNETINGSYRGQRFLPARRSDHRTRNRQAPSKADNASKVGASTHRPADRLDIRTRDLVPSAAPG